VGANAGLDTVTEINMLSLPGIEHRSLVTKVTELPRLLQYKIQEINLRTSVLLQDRSVVLLINFCEL